MAQYQSRVMQESYNNAVEISFGGFLFYFVYQELVSQVDPIKNTDCERGVALR
jgi:hypothetical protein